MGNPLLKTNGEWEGGGGAGGKGGRRKSFVCMGSRNRIIDIFIIIIILINCSGGDISKSPVDGDFFRLVLV